MSAKFRPLDVDAELQKLGCLPAKVAKPANRAPEISNFSSFSRGAPAKRKKAEFLPCRQCGRPAEIEAIEPSLDGKRRLTYWRCDPCQTSGVTPDNPGTPTSRKKEASRSRYEMTAEAVREDCFSIDPNWLVDNQPDLWQRLCWLDFKASEFERHGETEADYKQVLERIVETVKEARELYEQAMSKEAAAS